MLLDGGMFLTPKRVIREIKRAIAHTGVDRKTIQRIKLFTNQSKQTFEAISNNNYYEEKEWDLNLERNLAKNESEVLMMVKNLHLYNKMEISQIKSKLYQDYTKL